MTTLAVIPARYASTRLPGKPLANQTGRYLIQHVVERVRECALVDRVVVATDDERIAEAVASFGGEACMTRADHRSGTDRVGEVAAALGLGQQDLVLNVQGDEPDIDPAALERLIEKLASHGSDCGIATLAAPFDDAGPRSGPGSPLDPNCVKVVVASDDVAMYFSRSPIPYLRESAGSVDRPSRWLLHLGVYGFRADVLRRVTEAGGLKATELEKAESLEQLRWLESGIPISVVTIEHPFVGIDTPEDYAAFVRRENERASGAVGSSGG